ncbi:hypothetical protein C6V06_24440 [Burkholderia gladioli]|nr:hypothetical protein C6V06_24440 [Burkholderia gladioli]
MVWKTQADQNAGKLALGLVRKTQADQVIVALANKMARTIWAVLAHDRPYQKGYVSVKPT